MGARGTEGIAIVNLPNLWPQCKSTPTHAQGKAAERGRLATPNQAGDALKAFYDNGSANAQDMIT